MSYQYRDPHVKDKVVSWPSYLYYVHLQYSPYLGKMVFILRYENHWGLLTFSVNVASVEVVKLLCSIDSSVSSEDSSPILGESPSPINRRRFTDCWPLPDKRSSSFLKKKQDYGIWYFPMLFHYHWWWIWFSVWGMEYRRVHQLKKIKIWGPDLVWK